jgi:ribosomal protein S18 acetylase RimI-like enzyme
MVTIQTDISETALVHAIRDNLCDFFRFLTQHLSPGDGFENDKFARWYTPLPHPWFNGFLCNALPTESGADFIRETIQYFHEQQVDTFTGWLRPHLSRSDWAPLLSSFGFGFSDDTPGMAADLQTLPASPSMPQGLEIRTVEDEATMRVWTHVFTPGYGMPMDWEESIFDVWSKLGLDSPVRNYLGYLDGAPVSTSTVFYSAGVAGIYDVATLPEARGRGIGTALTLAPLLDARQTGYRIGVLQSSDMGFGVYKKMGFRHLCQIENFYLNR